MTSVPFPCSGSCAKDYLRIYEGDNEGGILRATVCGEDGTLSSIVVGTGRVFVRFHSDEAVQLGGFRVALKISGKQGWTVHCKCNYLNSFLMKHRLE